jgi:CxxC-x17-CxxC domain-containing protein
MYNDRPPRQNFDVVCAECGTQTTVPFKPSGTRPVLCRDCFAKNRPARSDRPPRRDFGGPGGGAGGADRQMFDVTCTRCGSAAQVPFKPTPGREVLCRDCFRGGRN